MEPYNFANSTGVIGLIPMPLYPSIDEIRNRLYNGVNPAGYQHIPERLWNAMSGKKSNQSIFRDDLWATYLQIPEKNRHPNRRKLKPSIYRPSKGSVEESVYRLPLDIEDQQNIIDEASHLGYNKNKVSRVLDHYLGDHTVGRGYDPQKGDYVSYYDRYDLNPFAGGTPIKTKVKWLDKQLRSTTADMDFSLGIGKPFSIYDRIYLDDYYRIPKEDRGGHYLPEVVIEPVRRRNK